MKPALHTFRNCGHTLTVRGRLSFLSPCPLCNGLKNYMNRSGFFKLEMDNKEVMDAAATLSLKGAKEGSYRRPESVFKEMYKKDPGTLSLWVTVGGKSTPQWVRDTLEGVKTVKKQSSWVQAAKMLGKELQAMFPDCRVFSTSSAYSGGTSVRAEVEATDPNREFTKEEKEKAKDLEFKYQAGHFDGMYDIYEYKEDPDPSIPTVSYVFVTLNNKASSNGGGD